MVVMELNSECSCMGWRSGCERRMKIKRPLPPTADLSLPKLSSK